MLHNTTLSHGILSAARSQAASISTLTTLASLVFASSAVAAPPLAELFFAVNHGDTKTDIVAGTTAQNGNQVYAATYNALDGEWQITYFLSVDHTTNPQASLTGTITVENKSNRETLAFEVGASIPICPAIEGESLIGGSALLTLTTVGPGTLSCDKDGEPILDCLGDQHAIESLLYCPTTLTSTGSSMISYAGTFGLPGPSQEGPTLIGEIGMREHFSITPKDKLVMQVTFFFKDADGATPPAPCPGDIDGDGIVGQADLAYIFADWGAEPFCPSAIAGDLDGDGQVGPIDLLLLLTSWGDCGDAG